MRAGAGWLILAVWVALGALLATLLRDNALAIGLGLVYVLAVEGLIGFAARSSESVAALAKALPRSNGGSLAALLLRRRNVA